MLLGGAPGTPHYRIYMTLFNLTIGNCVLGIEYIEILVIKDRKMRIPYWMGKSGAFRVLRARFQNVKGI